jgi:hypothetical protein
MKTTPDGMWHLNIEGVRFYGEKCTGKYIGNLECGSAQPSLLFVFKRFNMTRQPTL